MPRRSKRREEDLVHAAVQALEDEIGCWREGPPRYLYGPRDDMVTLVRYPRLSDFPIGPAEVTAQMEQTVTHIDLPRKEVPYFLRWQGMEAAIKKIRELDRQPEPAPPPAPEHVDETALINPLAYTGRDAPGFVVTR